MQLSPGVTASVTASDLPPNLDVELWLAPSSDYFFFLAGGSQLPDNAYPVGTATTTPDGSTRHRLRGARRRRLRPLLSPFRRRSRGPILARRHLPPLRDHLTTRVGCCHAGARRHVGDSRPRADERAVHVPRGHRRHLDGSGEHHRTDRERVHVRQRSASLLPPRHRRDADRAGDGVHHVLRRELPRRSTAHLPPLPDRARRTVSMGRHHERPPARPAAGPGVR